MPRNDGYVVTGRCGHTLTSCLLFSENSVAVIGAGPAGLMAAEVLAQGGAGVTVYDAMPSAGRKFLMAGRGGLNLTHSEPLPAFLARYGEAAPQLAAAIEAFPPEALARLERGAGAADLRRLQRPGISEGDEGLASCCARGCGGWTDGREIRAASSLDRLGRAGPFAVSDAGWAARRRCRATVLALGGASWPRLGSDGGVGGNAAAKGVKISPLRPANCGFTVAWSDIFRDRFEGQPLKGVVLSFGPHACAAKPCHADGHRGRRDLCAVGRVARSHRARGEATLHIALRPDLEIDASDRAAVGAEGQTVAVELLRKAAQLSPVAIGLLQEARWPPASLRRCRRPTRRADQGGAVKLTGIAPIARAISTAGGILRRTRCRLMLRRLPGVFAAGEMLDWEAPTGGYLLQASFATGAAAGRGVLRRLDSEKSTE